MRLDEIPADILNEFKRPNHVDGRNCSGFLKGDPASCALSGVACNPVPVDRWAAAAHGATTVNMLNSYSKPAHRRDGRAV